MFSGVNNVGHDTSFSAGGAIKQEARVARGGKLERLFFKGGLNGAKLRPTNASFLLSGNSDFI
jgi:hypothetical protein